MLLAIALMATWGALNVGCAPADAPPASDTPTGTAPAEGSGTSTSMNTVSFDVKGMM
jgi:hypothetical protein